MPSDDYAPVVRGGLKLKGSAPSGIKKKKKKVKPAVPSSATAESALASAAACGSISPSKSSSPSGADASKDISKLSASERSAEIAKTKAELADLQAQVADEDQEEERGYKTPAQKRQEEVRMRRLKEKFEREGGGKTHKQRVEELNRYLSGLSEHHDMPRIGPG